MEWHWLEMLHPKNRKDNGSSAFETPYFCQSLSKARDLVNCDLKPIRTVVFLKLIGLIKSREAGMIYNSKRGDKCLKKYLYFYQLDYSLDV